MMSSFPVIFSESEGVGNEDWDGGGANPHPFSSSELKMVQVSSQVGVAKMWDYLLFCVVFNPQKPASGPTGADREMEMRPLATVSSFNVR